MGVAPVGDATANKASAAAANGYRSSMATPFPVGTGPGSNSQQVPCPVGATRKPLKLLAIFLARPRAEELPRNFMEMFFRRRGPRTREPTVAVSRGLGLGSRRRRSVRKRHP